MEIILLLIGLCALGALSIRFGRDSRSATVHSKEHDLAVLGVAWDGQPGIEQAASADQIPVHPLRHRVAGVLYRLADWLYPGITEPQRSTSM